MVIGRGLIANAFFNEYRNDKKVVVFASGVSNSNETRQSEFDREKRLLQLKIKDNPEAIVVYFSTYSWGDPDAVKRPYISHKETMENIVKCHPRFLILRVSNVVGNNGNPNTIINFFVQKIISEELITVWNSTKRNLIDVNDLYVITKNLIQNKVDNKLLLVTNPKNFYVSEIVTKIAVFKSKTPKIEIVEKGEDFEMRPSDEVLKSIENLNLNFDDDYLINLLKKYY